MAEVHTDTTPAQPGHERRDFSLRVVALFGASMALLLAGSLALMAWLFDMWQAPPAGPAPRGATVAAAPPRPPGPRLQASPSQEMQAMRRAENAHLQSYQWVDRAAGMVRMPIERAMELVLEQGLPSWHEIPTPPTGERAAPLEERR